MKRGSLFRRVCGVVDLFCTVIDNLHESHPNWIEFERRLVQGIVGAQQAVVDHPVTMPNPRHAQEPPTRAAIPSQVWNFAMSGPPTTSASSHLQIAGPADANEHDLANAQFITFQSARWDLSHNQVVQQQSSSATPASRRSRQSPSPGEATNKRQRTEDKQHKGPAGV